MEGFPSAEQGDIADAAERVVNGEPTGFEGVSDDKLLDTLDGTKSQLDRTVAEVARRGIKVYPGYWDGEGDPDDEDAEEGDDVNAEEDVDHENG